MSWIWTALMPHPPILVPEVGRGGEFGASLTADGISGIMERICCESGGTPVRSGEKAEGSSPGQAPDRLLLISPHQPYAEGALAVNRSERAKGSFAVFGVPNVSFDLVNPVDDALALAKFLEGEGIPVGLTNSRSLDRDQGSMVPLYFLEKRLGTLPPVVLMNASGLGRELAYRMGRALAAFDDGQRWGFIASGDLSHRLTPTAPAGYSPSGEVFDRKVVEALERCDMEIIRSLSVQSIFEAGECGLCPVSAMIGFCSASGMSIDVLSYEGPFGVGYCCAISMKR